MSMTSSELNDLKSQFDSALAFSSEKEEMEHDAQMLAFSFLSEVEKYQALQGINRKTLAEKIKTSASYITQLFRGDKPLNFETLAKMQKALNIRFSITAKSAGKEMQIDEVAFLDTMIQNGTEHGYSYYRNTKRLAKENVYAEEMDKELLDAYDGSVFPA